MFYFPDDDFDLVELCIIGGGYIDGKSVQLWICHGAIKMALTYKLY